MPDKRNEYEIFDTALYYVDCEKEEQEQREQEMAERQKFVEGMKRYPEMGIPVYIDDKIPEEQDWEKLVAIRDDNRFYMADFVMGEVNVPGMENPDVALGRVSDVGGEYMAEPGKKVLTEIRWNIAYHGELMSETERRKRRSKRRRYGE